MKGVVIIPVAIMAALTYTDTSGAASKSMMHQREHRQVRTLHAYIGTINFFKHHRRIVQAQRTKLIATGEIRRARIWIRVIRRELAETRDSLRSLASAAISHVAGWLCIHRGEGAWSDNTGNGYYGGLQMQSGWGGVARADLLAPMDQIALADRVARSVGYSYSWMAGQWPNTFPPCAGYF